MLAFTHSRTYPTVRLLIKAVRWGWSSLGHRLTPAALPARSATPGPDSSNYPENPVPTLDDLRKRLGYTSSEFLDTGIPGVAVFRALRSLSFAPLPGSIGDRNCCDVF